ncbi:MAG TPA: dienelactone hydrolase family protein [Candidatus Limnocylindria bacterium]|nr:dienelactone hydrolase family protein [Candidatus Limnocylindria bacterium]
MKQSVSFPVAGTEVLAVLHLPAGETAGAIVVLPDRGMSYEDPDVLLTSNALEEAGVAALRFDWRSRRPSLDDAVGDVKAALALLKAHPALPGAIGVAGFRFGAAVAAVTAGRDSRVKVAVLAEPPAEVDGVRRPLVEVTRTRARVLVVRGEDDDADRYGPVLSQARVTHRIVERKARERLVREIADWAKESF